MAEPKPIASLSSGLLARKGAARPAMRRQGLSHFAPESKSQEDLGWNDMGYDVDPPKSVNTDQQNAGSQYGNLLAGAIPPLAPVDHNIGDQTAPPQYAADHPQSSDHALPGDPLDIGDLHDQPSLPDGDDHDPPLNSLAATGNDASDNIPEPRQTMDDTPFVVRQQDAIAQSFAQDESDQASQNAIVDQAATDDSPVAAETTDTSQGDHQVLSIKPQRTASPAILVAPRYGGGNQPDNMVRAKGKKAAFTLRIDPARHLRLRLASAVTGRSAQQLITEALDELLTKLPDIEDIADSVSHAAAR